MIVLAYPQRTKFRENSSRWGSLPLSTPMLDAVAIATWISVCIPWAEPRLAAALVVAGSGGEPLMITSLGKAPVVPGSRKEAYALIAATRNEQVLVGLTQIPGRTLDAAGLPRETALDACGNLEIGYQVLMQAYEQAKKAERSPWKQVSLAFNLFRDGKLQIETPYSKKVVEHLMTASSIAPAPMNSALRHEVVAAWSAGLATRTASQAKAPQLSILAESSAIASWARTQQ